jgi:hypothetical protein
MIIRHGYVGPRRDRYGTAHQKKRRELRPWVESGSAPCVRCGRLIEVGQAWDLDHAPDHVGYLGPSHASCNRAALGL